MTTERLTECPVCNNQAFSDWLVCKDYLVSNAEFQIQNCTKCGFKATNPRPDAAEIGQYYQSDQYISHSDTKQGLVSQLYHTVRKITVQQKVKLINQLQPQKGSLLDIGCGQGYFLEASKSAGWRVEGVEPDSYARAQASERNHIKVVSSISDLADNTSVAVTSMWHVLEHVHTLQSTLSWIRDHTQPKGYLIVAVPNYQSWDANYYKQYWAAFDVPRHLYHFGPDQMKGLLKRNGFTVKEQRPMLFDAFYVNLLSTKNRDGQPAYVESFLNGIRSNWSAYRNGGNFSSLIYIAQVN